jgi:hypothetical protein
MFRTADIRCSEITKGMYVHEIGAKDNVQFGQQFGIAAFRLHKIMTMDYQSASQSEFVVT